MFPCCEFREFGIGFWSWELGIGRNGGWGRWGLDLDLGYLKGFHRFNNQASIILTPRDLMCSSFLYRSPEMGFRLCYLQLCIDKPCLKKPGLSCFQYLFTSLHQRWDIDGFEGRFDNVLCCRRGGDEELREYSPELLEAADLVFRGFRGWLWVFGF